MKITSIKLYFLTCLFLIANKGFSQSDWLIDNSSFKAKVIETGDRIELSNGLVKRVIKISPNAATIQLDNLVSGESFLRGVKPEAEVKINGVNYEIGGLKGQPNYAFLKEEWIDQLKNSP